MVLCFHLSPSLLLLHKCLCVLCEDLWQTFLWMMASVTSKFTPWLHLLFYAFHLMRTNIHRWVLISFCFHLLLCCYPSLFFQNFWVLCLCLLFTACGWISCFTQPKKYFKRWVHLINIYWYDSCIRCVHFCLT